MLYRFQGIISAEHISYANTNDCINVILQTEAKQRLFVIVSVVDTARIKLRCVTQVFRTCRLKPFFPEHAHSRVKNLRLVE